MARQLSSDTASRFLLGSKSKYFSPDRTEPLPTLNAEGESVDLDGAGELQVNKMRRATSKRRNVSEVSGSSELPSKKKPSRPYAPPETYAHLPRLLDYLKNDLDGGLGSYPWEAVLTNVSCSRVLRHKVSHPYMHQIWLAYRAQSSREVVRRGAPLRSPNEPLLEVFDPVRFYWPYYRIRGSYSSGEI